MRLVLPFRLAPDTLAAPLKLGNVNTRETSEISKFLLR